MYSHTGILQSTSEAVPGLEHPLAWRPSGGLIVSTQRFGGFTGAGVGREGRHDVVFFERNGLRRGEFGLPLNGMKSDGLVREAVPGKKWGYRVKEILWSSDSNVLAVWLENESEDVGARDSYLAHLNTDKTQCSSALGYRELSLVGCYSSSPSIIHLNSKKVFEARDRSFFNSKKFKSFHQCDMESRKRFPDYPDNRK